MSAAVRAVSRKAEETRSRILETALALFRELGNKSGIADQLYNFGWDHRKMGNVDQARAMFQESLRLSQEMGNPPMIVRCLECLAVIAVAQGREQRAVRLFGAAEVIREMHAIRVTQGLERQELVSARQDGNDHVPRNSRSGRTTSVRNALRPVRARLAASTHRPILSLLSCE